MTHYIVMHELGHVLDFRFTRYVKDKSNFNRYRELRGWPRDEYSPEKWKSEDSLKWHEQVTEWFAEDFRYLFGGPLAQQEFWGLSCDPPGPEIREFMISIASD